MTVSIELQMEQMGQRAKKAARVLSAARRPRGQNAGPARARRTAHRTPA